MLFFTEEFCQKWKKTDDSSSSDSQNTFRIHLSKHNKLKHQNTIQSLSVRPSSKYFPHPPTTIHFLQHYPGLRPWLVSANDNHYEYDQVTFITQRQDSHRLQIMAAREAPSVIENQNLNLVNQTNFTTGHLSLFIDWLG